MINTRGVARERRRRGRHPLVLLGVFVALLFTTSVLGRCASGTAPEGPSAAEAPTARPRGTKRQAGVSPPVNTQVAPASQSGEPSLVGPLGTHRPSAATGTREVGEHFPPTPTAPSLRPASVAPRAPTASPAKPRTYTVQAGDNLWSISQEFGITISDLARANRLDPDAALQVGQRLVIPSLADSVGIPLPPVQNDLARPAQADLTQLAPELVQYLRGRAGSSAAAIYVSGSDTLYTYNPTERFQLASTVKVPIMVAQLDKAQRGSPSSGLPNASLLRPMITYSDNAAATALLAEVGGPTEVEAAARKRGLMLTEVNPDAWGLSTSTAPEMALLMRSLYFGEGLNEPLRGLAFRLMAGVIPEQRWGVPAGLPATSAIAFKGGWLPRGQGWLVHQVGLVVVDGEPVVFAFLNKGQPTFEYGKATLRRSGMYLAAKSGDK